MITSTSTVKSILFKIKTDKPVRKTPYQVKGVIMKQFPNDEIVPMLNGAYRKKFLYPRIQVKVLDEEIFIIGLNQGVDPIMKIKDEIKELNFGDITFKVENCDLEESTQIFNLTSNLIKYKFISNWVALNYSTNNKYQNMNDANRLEFLNKLLGENIVFLAREVGFDFEKNIFSRINISSLEPISEDQKGWGAFQGEFYSNIILPNYIGIGNGITRGYGTIFGETRDENIDFNDNEFNSLKDEALESKISIEENNIFSSIEEIEVDRVPKPVISRKRKQQGKRNRSKKLKSFSNNGIKSNRKANNKSSIKNKSKMKNNSKSSINYNSEEYHKKQHTIQ
ncbi:MAG: CRISPR-associated endonuclease Cas6 [Candidatus Neomarinimicrobiota bacterium]|nr:CRISPR-associated endonuclease Cas6 [Candidatus Neomarinimicrobiota bacterium]